jgi:hypothetical protein
MTSTSKLYLPEFNAPSDSSYPTCADSNNESDDSDVDLDEDIGDLRLADCYDHRGNANLKHWFTGMKRDPVGRAHRVVHLLCTMDQRREGFCAFIKDGNDCGWFTAEQDNGDKVVKVPVIQLLRDVKMRWDSVYLMVCHL